MPDSTERTPGLTPACNDGADAIVCAMTAEGRRQFLQWARVMLPGGQPLKLLVEEILGKESRNEENALSDALDAKGKETIIAVWRAIEAQKEAAGRKMTQIIDDYRNAAIGKMQLRLYEGAIVEEELDDLKQQFEIGHGHYPESRAWVYLGGLLEITGPGSLHFRELANRVARSTRAGDDAWKYWLEILVGYLLKNDHDDEYITRFPAGRVVRPTETTNETRPSEIILGEYYEIRGLFKASEHCCSWLKRGGWDERGSPLSSLKAPAAEELGTACAENGGSTEREIPANGGHGAVVVARRHGFQADMARHESIANVVDQHAANWRTSRMWRGTSILGKICTDLDRAQIEIPISWRTGKTPSLAGVKLKGWEDALEVGGKKLVADHIGASLDKVKREPSKPALHSD